MLPKLINDDFEALVATPQAAHDPGLIPRKSVPSKIPQDSTFSVMTFYGNHTTSFGSQMLFYLSVSEYPVD